MISFPVVVRIDHGTQSTLLIEFRYSKQSSRQRNVRLLQLFSENCTGKKFDTTGWYQNRAAAYVEGQHTNVNVMLLRRSFEDGATVLSLSTTLLFILLLLVVFLKPAHKSNLR